MRSSTASAHALTQRMPDVVAVHFKDLDRGVQGGVMLVPVAPSSADGREGARCMKHDIAGG
jgi:hypothetical protein